NYSRVCSFSIAQAVGYWQCSRRAPSAYWLVLRSCRARAVLNLTCGRENFCYDSTHVFFRGAMVDDTCTQREPAVNTGVRNIDAAAAVHAIQNGSIQLVHIPCRAAVAKAHGAQRDRRKPLEPGLGIDCVREHAGQAKVLANRVRKGT